MPRKPQEAPPAPFGLDRLVFFSDAVMAIAITLLVLDLRVPEVANELTGDPGRVLADLWPKLLGYAISFWVIALYWMAHHRCYRYIRRYDRRLMYLNFLFLMFIAFMPFPTALLFSSPAQTLPVMLYAGTAAGMGLSLALLWIYAGRRRFIPRIMKSKPVVRILPALLSGLLLIACSAPDQAQFTTQDGVVRIILGFTISKTGSLNVESTRQTNGLNLWMQQVNEAGGVELKDGTVVKFDAKYYDDQSTKNNVQQLYTRLATKDNATFLISPYSSGLTDAAAVIAEQYGKIMITTGAASDSTYERGFSLVYQAYTPASGYLTGAVDLLKNADPAAKRLAILHENDKFSTDVCNAVRDYAVEQGYEVVFFEGYDSGTTDFAPFINKIASTTPDAILGGGHFQDGSTFARQLYEKQIPIKMVVLLVAPPESNFAEIGDAALGIIGPSQWETQENYTAETAQVLGLPFYGPSGADFVSSYRATYGEDPSYHAAGGYAAGLILQNAIETAGSLDSGEIQAVLDAMDILTFFGRFRFSASPENHGLQVGHTMAYIQWQENSSGTLEKQLVWPAEVGTARLLYPIR